jgi:imidazoleglycerol-phosphate dehydratase
LETETPQRWYNDIEEPLSWIVRSTSVGRTAVVHRQTHETSIKLELSLDGSGRADVQTGIGFFDHMLNHLARHSLMDLVLRAEGDRHIDDHHTVEDVGLCLGTALVEALGDKRGINRYGHFTLPMDETLTTVAVDLSGRPAFVWKALIPSLKIGSFDSELAEEFWRAVTNQARMNFHAVVHHGSNSHHIVESLFKAAARALRMATSFDEHDRHSLPTTKGSL